MVAHGVVGPVGRLRAAAGGDASAIRRLLRHGGVPERWVDEVGIGALGVGAVGSAVRAAAVPGGGAPVLRRTLEPLLRSGDLHLARTLCTTITVVEDDQDVVGVVVVAPAASLLEHVSPRVDERVRRGVVNRGTCTVAEVRTVVVADGWRRRGVGTRLVVGAVGLHRAAGYLQVLGRVPDRPALLAFTGGTGLQVEPARVGVDLTAVLGVPTVVGPAARHRLVHLGAP